MIYKHNRLNVDSCTRGACRKVDFGSIKKQYDDIKKVLNEGVQKKYFSKKFANQMLPEKPKPGAFYLLPKVHKEYINIPKGRPIVPGCGSNTEFISWFCDQSVKERVKLKDSYIEDTPDILRYFEKLNEDGAIPVDSKPVTIDVKSMYTHIPTEDGLATFKEEIEL